MDAGHVALAALCRREAAGAADREELAAKPLLIALAQQVVEPDAVAADHHQVCRPQTVTEQMNLDSVPGFQKLPLSRDDHETIGSAEGRHRAGAFSHRIGSERCGLRLIGGDETNEEIFRAATLGINPYRQSGQDNILTVLRTVGETAEHRRNELAEGEDRRRWKAGQNHNGNDAAFLTHGSEAE